MSAVVAAVAVDLGRRPGLWRRLMRAPTGLLLSSIHGKPNLTEPAYLAIKAILLTMTSVR